MERGRQQRAAVAGLLALPGLGLAAAGLFHPHGLNPDTAFRWYSLHLPALLLFPLVGLALAWLVRGRNDPLAWLVRLTAYTYATFYTALDVISGIAAGWVTWRLGAAAVPRPEEVSLLFRIGTPLGEVGSWALLACAVLVVIDRAVRRSYAALVALLLLPGAWLVHIDHIFSPLGVAGMTLLGLGSGAVWLLDGAHPASSRTREASAR